SPVYYVFREKENNSLKFINYIMQTSEFQKELKKYANGILEIRLRLSSSDILKRPIAFPNYIEQQNIVKFLDEKCREIDNIIKNTEQSIEEYKKLKQSVITKAVTKGIRPNRPMQNSNIEWIGAIPEDWNVKKLKYMFEIKKDIAGKEGYTVLSITQTGIKTKDITSNEGQLASDYSKYQLVSKGDFAMNHMDLLTGWVDISQYDGVTSPDYRVFKLKETHNCDRYFLYMMQLCYLNKIFYGLGQGVSGFGRWRLPAEMFLNFLIPIPPRDEQKEIADYLDEKCAEIDILIEKKQQFLSEMVNYKKSLIYEYVTGKKEVS
ncbi:MAG: restriction endonuclease subunit S, partial [bacterium]|nr:restriction endonuclease subunit S [bacterium]